MMLKDVTDEMVAAVEQDVGTGRGAWDMADPKCIIASAVNAATLPPADTIEGIAKRLSAKQGGTIALTYWGWGWEATRDELTASGRTARSALRKLENLIQSEDKQYEARARDDWGRLVREVWIQWAKAHPNPKPSWLVPYDELPEADKEADRMIGEAVAAEAAAEPLALNSRLQSIASNGWIEAWHSGNQHAKLSIRDSHGPVQDAWQRSLTLEALRAINSDKAAF